MFRTNRQQTIYLIWLVYFKKILSTCYWLTVLAAEVTTGNSTRFQPPKNWCDVEGRDTEADCWSVGAGHKCPYGNCSLRHENGWNRPIPALGQAHTWTHVYTGVGLWRLPMEVILSRELKEHRGWQDKGGWSGCFGRGLSSTNRRLQTKGRAPHPPPCGGHWAIWFTQDGKWEGRDEAQQNQKGLLSLMLKGRGAWRPC